MTTKEVPSNCAVNRAGDYLRNLARGDQVDFGKWAAATEVLLWFRSRWSSWPHPLKKVDLGLRSMAYTATGASARVSQRLKRVDRIVDKLRRFSTLNLAQMQDIGGCRVVLPTLAELQALRTRIHRKWAKAIDDEDDWIANPRQSGYRAVHVIVKRDGRLVEIQLRTRRQHRWAASVEHVEQRNVGWIRDSQEGAPLTDAFRDLGIVFALRDEGKEVPPELQDRLKHWLSAIDEDV